MINQKIICLGLGTILLMSCATRLEFPVSKVTPAASITAKIKEGENKNKTIDIKVLHLASADRLSPPANIYVVWIKTKKNGINNIGTISNENAKQTSIRVTTPFEIKEIFITAEEEGGISNPSGMEISRVSF